MPSHPMAEQLLAATHALANTDFGNLIGIKFLVKFRKELRSRSFTDDQAEKIVARVQVELAEDSLSDDQLAQLASDYARVLRNIADTLQYNGFADATEVVLEKARTMSLRLT